MKPCPWCDDDNLQLDLVTIPTRAGDGYAIECSNCGCFEPVGEWREQAIQRWDARDRQARVAGSRDS